MNDQEYIRRVRALEGRLYRVAQAMLWRQEDSLDAVQEAVFRGWLKKDQLNNPDRLEPWLMSILVNECRSAIRRRRRGPLPLDVEIAQEDRLCEDLQLRLALRRLPEKYRLPLVLHHLEGYSIKEIALTLKLPPGLVTSRLHQARRALRELLDGGDRV
ncbi:MAG: sigma-70 family RNA polymerase sigma factor [Clostridia bacterium]|nr:sigma-70 family RNA polymerase sigma factor [Clostridia bacterium]